MYLCRYIINDVFTIFTFLFIRSRCFDIEYATRNPLKKKNVSTANKPDATDINTGSEYPYFKVFKRYKISISVLI